MKRLLKSIIGSVSGGLLLHYTLGWIGVVIVAAYMNAYHSKPMPNSWVQYHKEFIPLVIVVWLIIGFIDHRFKLLKEEKIKRKDENYRIENEKKRLNSLLSDSNRIFKSLPDYFRNAENHTDNAESMFIEGLYSPFWDEIENSLTNLSKYKKNVGELILKIQNYNNSAPALNLPSFNLPLNKLPDARITANRLKLLLNEAHKDPTHTHVYEQRKQNKILIEGFNNLTSAVYNIGEQITYEINNLSSTTSISMEKLFFKQSERLSYEGKMQKTQSRILKNIEDHRRGIKPIL